MNTIVLDQNPCATYPPTQECVPTSEPRPPAPTAQTGADLTNGMLLAFLLPVAAVVLFGVARRRAR